MDGNWTKKITKQNKKKNKLLITQRNQGIEGSRGQICLLCAGEAAPTGLWMSCLKLLPFWGQCSHWKPSGPLRSFFAWEPPLINSMASWDTHSFIHLWLRHPFKWNLFFQVDDGGGGLKGGATKRTREHHSRDGPWSKKNNVSPWIPTTNMLILSKNRTALFCSWVQWEGHMAGLRKQRLTVPVWPPLLFGDSCFVRVWGKSCGCW